MEIIVFYLNLDARFNKGLIENCQSNINKHCQLEAFDYNDDKKNPGNENNNDVNDREMDGRLIQCLWSKYVDTSVTLDSQCITELIDVI